MRWTAQLLAGVVLLGGCGVEPAATEAAASLQSQAAGLRQASGAAEHPDLAILRRVTAPFHEFGTAAAAGWSVEITRCMSDPAGAMGRHYGNVGLIDGSVRVDEPELLLYEPERNGRLRLVAVEYIIPYTARSRDATPPVLFGEKFKQNDTFELWGLHVWVGKHNPAGMFASWNPDVTCQYETDPAAMSHR